MAPPSTKGKAKPTRDSHRRSPSVRNSTPLSASSAIEPAGHTPYIRTPMNPNISLSDTAIEDIITSRGNASSPPSAYDLRGMLNDISAVLATIKTQQETHEQLLRETAAKKKERAERDVLRQQEERELEERRAKMKKVTPKKREREEERPPAIGAHGLARQDGMDLHRGDDSSSSLSPASQPPSLPDASAKVEAAGSPSSTTSLHQPPAAPSVQQYQVFGEDPSKYPDPTIYHIREMTPDMSEEDKKVVLNVGHYPPDDLHDHTCGTPPDRDYSQPKPAQQVTFQTFLNYVEPYVRPLTEEDRAFLLERGDREKPFIIPKLGTKHYTEIWAEEDDRMPPHHDVKVTDNEPRGSMDQMNDDVAESDEVSAGPLMSRLLQMLRPGGRNNDNDNMPNGTAEDMDVDGEERREVSKPETQPPPPTQLPDWKNAPPMPKPDYVTMDERIKQELVHLGFLSSADPPAYTDSLDDEVCARLRYLQSELRRQSIINGARKARILELAEEHMAGQEWSTISEDLDNQLNQAYLKRNRNIGKKGSKIKRPGGAGGGSHVVGVARAQSAGVAVGVGEPIRGLMERKQKWTEWIGPVVNYGKTKIPEDTIFDKASMDRLGAKEQESWGEVEDV